MSRKARKQEMKDIMKRLEEAVGRPKPVMGADIPPGTWVSEYCLEWFAYYVMEPPVCDENGVAKEITLIRPEFRCELVMERNKPSRDVYHFETYEECMTAYRNGCSRWVVVIHEKDGQYCEHVSERIGEYYFGLCKEDHDGF